MLLILSTGPLCRPLQFEEACIIEIAYACVSEMQVTKVVLLHSSTPGGQCVRACCGLIFGDYTANHMVQTLEDWAGKQCVCVCVRACVLGTGMFSGIRNPHRMANQAVQTRSAIMSVMTISPPRV